MPEPLSSPELRRLEAFLGAEGNPVDDGFFVLGEHYESPFGEAVVASVSANGRKAHLFVLDENSPEWGSGFYADAATPFRPYHPTKLLKPAPEFPPDPSYEYVRNPLELLPVDRHIPALNWTLMGIPLKTFVVFLAVNIAFNAAYDAIRERSQK